MSLRGLRWLLPSALYRRAGLAMPVLDPDREPQVRPTRKTCRTIVDGPVSQRLDASLRPLIPVCVVPRRVEDFRDPDTVTGTILYRGHDGGFVRVLRRRLTGPLLLDAIVDPRRDGDVRERSTGTDVVRCDDDVADVHRLVMVRPNGTLLIVDSIGIPAAGTRAPLSGAQLDALATRLDDPSCDLDGGAV